MSLFDNFTGEKLKFKWGEYFPAPAQRRLFYLDSTMPLIERVEEIGDYNEQRNQAIADKAVNNLVGLPAESTATKPDIKVSYTSQLTAPKPVSNQSSTANVASTSLAPMPQEAESGQIDADFARQLIAAVHAKEYGDA